LGVVQRQILDELTQDIDPIEHVDYALAVKLLRERLVSEAG